MGTGEPHAGLGKPFGVACLGQGLLLLVNALLLDRHSVEKLLDSLELLRAKLDGSLGLSCRFSSARSISARAASRSERAWSRRASWRRARAFSRSLSPAGAIRDSARAMSRRASASRTAALAASRAAGDDDLRRRRALGGLRFPESCRLLVDQPMLNSTPLDQLAHPVALLPAVFPLGGGRGGLSLGLIDERLGNLPFGLGDLEAGLGDLEAVLSLGGGGAVLAVAGGFLRGWSRGRVLGEGLAGNELPGDDPGGARPPAGRTPRTGADGGMVAGLSSSP